MTDQPPVLETIAGTVTRLLTGWTDIVMTSQGLRRIDHPGLLQQLNDALTESTPTDVDTSAKSIPDSKPPVPEQPFDVLMAVHRFEKTAPKPIGQIVGWASTAAPDVQAALSLELLGLVRRADIALGHAYAPRPIDGLCPVCSQPKGLMVNMTDQGPTDAWCRKCHTTWDTPELGILARMLEAG